MHKTITFLFERKIRLFPVAFLLGCLATLTLPPFFILPAAIPAYGGLFLLLRYAPATRAAAAIGWWWGWGFFISGLYWFGIALMTDAARFAWLIPFAVFGLTGVIALYISFFAVCFRALSRGRRNTPAVFLFSSLWVLAEYARAHLFTGFPWNLSGYALAFSASSLQTASLGGIYMLSWLLLLFSLSPVLWLVKQPKAGALIFMIPVAACLWGAWRVESSHSALSDTFIRLVQGNISQPHKWNPERQAKNLETYIGLSLQPAVKPIQYIIWPETAVPYPVERDTTLAVLLGRIAPKDGALITGALTQAGEGENWQIWNSLIALDNKGDFLAEYHKHKLVPFGEFVPFRSFLPLEKITHGSKDFSTGEKGDVLHLPGGLGFLPLICYEAIFPDSSFAGADHARPQFLLNITNDAWFGNSTAPYQHFQMARVRAVEQGMPLVRVANTGVSGIIDGVGRVILKTKLNEQGVFDGAVPKSLNQQPFYAHYPYLFLISLIISGILAYKRNVS